MIYILGQNVVLRNRFVNNKIVLTKSRYALIKKKIAGEKKNEEHVRSKKPGKKKN